MFAFHFMLLVTTTSAATVSSPISSGGGSLSSVNSDRGMFEVNLGHVETSAGFNNENHINVEIKPFPQELPLIHHDGRGIIDDNEDHNVIIQEVSSHGVHPDEILHNVVHRPDHTGHVPDDHDRPHTVIVHSRPRPHISIVDHATDVVQPILHATEPLQDAVSPIKAAVLAKPAATLAAAGLGVKKLLTAKAVLAAPFVGLGSAVAAPFVKVGAKFAALVIKGGKVVGAVLLKGAAVKAKTALTLGALKLAKLTKKAAPLFILKGKKLIPLAAAGLTKAKLAAVTSAAAAAGTAGLAFPTVINTASGPQRVTLVQVTSEEHAPHPNSIDENIFNTESGFDLNIHSKGPLGSFNLAAGSDHATRVDVPASSSHIPVGHLVDMGNGKFAFETESGFDLNAESDGPLGGFHVNTGSDHATNVEVSDSRHPQQNDPADDDDPADEEDEDEEVEDEDKVEF